MQIVAQWLLREPDGERSRISFLKKNEIPLVPCVGDKVDLLGESVFTVEKVIWVEENAGWFVSVYVEKGERDG